MEWSRLFSCDHKSTETRYWIISKVRDGLIYKHPPYPNVMLTLSRKNSSRIKESRKKLSGAWISRGSYGVYVVVTGSTSRPHSKNYGVKITPPVLIEDHTMHFTPVLKICGVISTPSATVVILTPLVVIYFNTLWCYVQTLECNFNTWGCGPLLTPTGVILTPQFLRCVFIGNCLLWLVRDRFMWRYCRGIMRRPSMMLHSSPLKSLIGPVGRMFNHAFGFRKIIHHLSPLIETQRC